MRDSYDESFDARLERFPETTRDYFEADLDESTPRERAAMGRSRRLVKLLRRASE